MGHREEDPHPAGAGYTPMVAPEQAELIRRWHERAYQAARAEAVTEQTFTYLGRTVVVPPQVQPITGMSHLLGEAVLAEVRAGDRVLDMGTGSGVNAILAASTAKQVLAVDINPVAVEAARGNAERNGVADRVEVRLSDVFGDVDGRFDLIVFDPPFRWFSPRDLLEAATTDENYRAMTSFFRQAREHLTPAGRMLISFGSSGDLLYLRHLMDEQGFAVEVVAQQDLAKDGQSVSYFTFRLT
ncbi:methyltransferase [Nonomuraea sp. CA-141351]|uniref:methyltransferase n=1 Tax=Nonomuraea sp. CA-141351 TaxID=3239996 RepID=UPI003D8D524C